jgi:DNA-binding XRE family transcriptional regulator
LTASHPCLHEVLREARRRKGLTQSEVAEQVKCKQSAISMFEAGRSGALARDLILKLAKLLDVDVKTESLQAEEVPSPGPLRLKYCPLADCPSNVPYVVGGRLCFRPSLVEESVAVRSRCRLCGEPMEASCPNPECRTDVAEGSFCRTCGAPYVVSALVEAPDSEHWAEAQRTRIRDLQAMTRTIRRREGGGLQ